MDLRDSTPHPAETDPASTESALRVIAETARRTRMCAQLAVWHPEFSPDEIADAFHTAYRRAADGQCRATSVGEAYRWLRITAHRCLQRERDRRRFELPVPPNEPILQRGLDEAGPVERLIEHEDELDLATLASRVLAGLSERQLRVLSLHLHGNTRGEIAARLGISVRAVKRELKRITDGARDELCQLAGGGCQDGQALVMRLAYGLANTAQAAQARAHLTGCGRCAQFSQALESWREKAAAMLPLPAAEAATPGLVERTVHGAADGVARVKQQLADTAAGLRQGVVDGGAQLKQQTGAAYYRALDPTPLAGMRPGAAATVIAGCLALGGGATYCASEAVDPFGAAKGLIAPDRDRPEGKPVSDPPEPVETIAAPAPAPAPVEPPPAPAPAPEPEVEEPAPAPIQPQPAPPSSDSFSGLSGDPTPAPAPPSGGTDFGGL